jgi:TonB family protein
MKRTPGLILTFALLVLVPAATAADTTLTIRTPRDSAYWEVDASRARVPAPHPASVILPDYPPSALRARVEGRVLISGVINPEGRVTDLQCLACEKDAAGFASSAIAALEKWVYEPAYSPAGEPLAVTIIFDVRFTP